jgi:TP901 family phage tail tape measure protein
MSPELKAFIVFQAIDKATNIIKNIQGSIGDTVGRLQKIQGAALAVGGATLLALKSAADSAANFESSLTPLGTVVTSTMGSMEKSLKAFASAAKEWSNLHKQSAEEFLQASYQMSSAGLNDIQAIEGTRKALALATATMGDSTEAANLLALSYNNFADQNADVAKEMSRLFKSHNWKLKRVSLKSKV